MSGVGVRATAVRVSTALAAACHMAALEVVRVLIDAGANTSVQDTRGRTALFAIPVSHTDSANIAITLANAGADTNCRDGRLRTPLHHICSSSRASADLVRAIISGGGDVNARDKKGATPLSNATRVSGSVEVVRALLAAGADVHARDCKGRTPLFVACKYQYEPDVAGTLLAAGAEVGVVDAKGRSALLMAIGRCKETARRLVLAGARLDFVLTSRRFQSLKGALFGAGVAAEFAPSTFVPVCVAAGLDVNAADPDTGETLLHYCASIGNAEAVSALIAGGADVNRRTNRGKGWSTPLHSTAQQPYYGGQQGNAPECVAALLAAGADYRALDENGLTPLERAVHCNATTAAAHMWGHSDREMAAMPGVVAFAYKQADDALLLRLLEAGADPKMVTGGCTLVHHVCHYRQWRAIRYLLEHGASFTELCTHNVTPPDCFLIIGNPQFTDVQRPAPWDAIAANVDVVNAIFAANPSVAKPRHLLDACLHGCVGVVSALLRAGVPVDCRDAAHFGMFSRAQHLRTPLHVACASNARSLDILRVLLDAGADPNARSSEGLTALHHLAYSTAEAGEQAMRLLVDRGASKVPVDNSGQTFWHIHATSQSLGYWLRVDGAQDVFGGVNAVDAEGRTPLDTLCEARWFVDANAQALFDAGADVNHVGPGGLTPLLRLCHNMTTSALAILLGRGADIRAVDSKGRTALHLAVRRKVRTEVAVALLDAGVDPKVKDAKGRTAYDYAVADRLRELETCFEEKEADIVGDPATESDQVRLHSACAEHDMYTAEELCESSDAGLLIRGRTRRTRASPFAAILQNADSYSVGHCADFALRLANIGSMRAAAAFE